MYQLLPSSVPYVELRFFLKTKSAEMLSSMEWKKVKYKSGT